MTQPAKTLTLQGGKIVERSNVTRLFPGGEPNRELGTEFSYNDRMSMGWSVDNPRELFDYSDWEARDLHRMLTRDYRSQQLELVLAGPLMGAEKSIEPVDGDTGEADLLRRMFASEDDTMDGSGCQTDLEMIFDQKTSAFCYKKSFHEIVPAPGVGEFDGQIIYRKVAWRPQTTCRTRRLPTGQITGFEQDVYFTLNPGDNMEPRFIKNPYASIYVHGQRRDPINGISDMEIAYWAYKTKQRVLFLLLQYLENVSLPRTVVKGQDETEVKQAAAYVAQTKGSGVVPVWSQTGPTGITVEQLDVSGKGSDQFFQMIKWLDAIPVQAVLAGFLELTGAASNGAGSLALSADASDFYLQSLKYKQGEVGRNIRKTVFAPVCIWNFGPGARIPILKQAPLQSEDKTAAVDLFSKILGGRDPALVPQSWVSQLAIIVSDYLGIDSTKVEADFAKAEADAKAAAAKAAAAGASPLGQTTAGAAGVAKAALDKVKAAQQGNAKNVSPPLAKPMVQAAQ